MKDGRCKKLICYQIKHVLSGEELANNKNQLNILSEKHIPDLFLYFRKRLNLNVEIKFPYKLIQMERLSISPLLLLASLLLATNLAHCKEWDGTGSFSSVELNRLGRPHPHPAFSKGLFAPNPTLQSPSPLQKVLNNNQQWANQMVQNDPTFFSKHTKGQNPPYLWIGCSDSRVIPNDILGLGIGEVFVLRNVGNLVSSMDTSYLAVLQYAVVDLKVTDILVAGHYGCGGVKASLQKMNHGALQAWLHRLRKIHYKHRLDFKGLTPGQEYKKMVELNVREQVMNVASSRFVQQAWKKGQTVRVHGLAYNLSNGRLNNLGCTMDKLAQIPRELKLF